MPILYAMSGGQSTIEGVTADAGRVDKILADASGLSRERIKALLSEGRIRLNGQPASQPAAKLPIGTHFAIRQPAPTAAAAQAQDIPLVVAYEDDELIVIDKPAGLVVHPANGNLDGTLVNALLHHCAGQLSGIGGVARPGIVHRIDKDTSGLLVAAKSNAAHEGLARQFADHSLERAYMAITAGQPMPSSGTVTGAIGRSSANRKKMALVEEGHGKHAITHYRTLERMALGTGEFSGGGGPVGAAALIQCRLETGRTHQIRVHMASIGHSLLGDALYGKTPGPLRRLLADLKFERQALHAAVLGFIHPTTGKQVRFESSMPDDMRELLGALRADVVSGAE
jgi:23S rRNA pseudouridine1911/1915/1917 synthase